MADLSTSLEHGLINGCNMIPLTRNITIITSAWLLLMPWRLFDTRLSATIAMAKLGRCVSGVINVMTYQSVICSVVPRLFHARPSATYSSLVLANHTRSYVGRRIHLTHLPWTTKWLLESPRARSGFRVWNLFMTRRVIKCHKLYDS